MSKIIGRAKGFLDGRDMYDTNLVASITKAINKEENPTKIKHVRSVIISSHHEQGSSTFWSTVMKMQLQSYGPTCWKFCHVLHKLMREGHKNVIFDSMKYLTWLDDLGNNWGHLPENFGPLNAHYLKLLTTRLKFHKKHIKIGGNLVIEDEVLAEITGNEANGYFEFCIEVLDLMDDIVNLQRIVFHQMDRTHENSMTTTGQCKLYPLVLAVQDSCQIYDYIVKMLFKLHKAISPETLGDLRDRFNSQYKSLKNFYQTCQSLQYYKGLIQVPSLPDLPPNFLVYSELSKHRKPVAVVAGEDTDDEPDQPPPPPPVRPAPAPVAALVDPTPEPTHAEPVPDARDLLIGQLKAQIEQLKADLEYVKAKAREKIGELNGEIENLKAQLSQQKQEAELGGTNFAAARLKLSENQQELDKLKESVHTAEASLNKSNEEKKAIYDKFKVAKERFSNLTQQHAKLIREHDALKKTSTSEKKTEQENEQKLKEATEDLERLRSEQNVLQENLQKSSDESTQQSTQLQEAIDKLCKEKAEVEEKLIAAESEKDTLRTQVNDYQTTASSLESNLKLEQESRQQSADTLGQELQTLKGQLGEVQGNAASLDEKNQELLKKLESLESDRTTERDTLNSKLSTLEGNLAGLVAERDQAQEEKSKSEKELEAKISELKQLMNDQSKQDEEERRRQAYNSLVMAVDKGVEEVNYTLDFIASEEFVSHTCNADAAVADLRKLDDEITEMSKSIENSCGTAELSHLVHAFTHRLCRTLEESKAACNRAPPEQGDELAEKCHSLGNDSVDLMNSIKSEYGNETVDKSVLQASLDKVRQDTEGMLTVARTLLIRGDDINVNQIGELVEEELNATQQAIQEGAQKIQDMLMKSRARDTGTKLQVNEKILDSVTKLMAEIQQLVRKSKSLQEEIVSTGRGSATAKEFYKKNHRWTEGLVSAAKAVGWGASTLVEKAERIIEGEGTLNELKVCSNEIAASTAQLVITSQVKADKESGKLTDLKSSAKNVRTATADVVASSNFGQQMIDEADLMNFDDLSLTQTKRVEMNTQVFILELESKLVKERKKLAEIRKRHYQLAAESEGWELNENGE